MTPTPWWATLLTALGGSLVGGLFTFAGAAWSQRATRERELTMDELRHARHRADQLRDIRHQLFVDMAEHVEDRQVWYENINAGRNRAADLATLGVHRNQLTGRVKLYTTPVVQQVWLTLIRADGVIDDEINMGHYHHDQSGDAGLYDERCVPRAQAAAALMTAAIRLALAGDDAQTLTLDDEEALLLAEVRALPAHPYLTPTPELVSEICSEAFARLRAAETRWAIDDVPQRPALDIDDEEQL
ncbi:hypothetical protein ABTW72_05180 [Micromonospora sp. NPDC127501]|uniref:hypothetical protein n=1 Tax=Micromonospora sp. NPDC127501 TaxID=3154872 RepID=UPI003331103D